MKQKPTLLKAVSAGAIVMLAFSVVFLLARPSQKANVTFVVAPSVAKMTVDGKQNVKPGTAYVAPGTHKLVATFNGFADLTINFTSKADSVTTVNVIMTPNSQAGYDWVAKHPDDQRTGEKVGGEDYSETATTLLTKFPIVRKLPTSGAGNEYIIGYGAMSTKAGKTVLEIDITYRTIDAKQSALAWLESQGYDMSMFDIKYTDATHNPPAVDNPGTH